jgi:hypothetical protein
MRPLEQGRPIHGEVVRLTPRDEMPHLYDAETEFVSKEGPGAGPEKKSSDVPQPRAAATGPAQVASDTYRRNWDAIWKRPAKRVMN